MFGLRYTLSCFYCDTEYKSKSHKKIKAFEDKNNNKCPVCGNGLSGVPLMRTRLTPPPELREYKVNVKIVNVD